MRLLVAISLYLKAEIGDLGLETLEALGDGLEGHLDLATLHAEGFELLPGDLGLGEETLGLAVQASESSGCLSLFIASLRYALDELHGGAAILFGLLLG